MRNQAFDSTSTTHQQILDLITPTNVSKALAQFPIPTATGTDGLAVTDLLDAPQEAIVELTGILRSAVANLDPPAQWPFTYLAGVPKKDPPKKGQSESLRPL